MKSRFRSGARGIRIELLAYVRVIAVKVGPRARQLERDVVTHDRCVDQAHQIVLSEGAGPGYDLCVPIVRLGQRRAYVEESPRRVATEQGSLRTAQHFDRLQ